MPVLRAKVLPSSGDPVSPCDVDPGNVERFGVSSALWIGLCVPGCE